MGTPFSTATKKFTGIAEVTAGTQRDNTALKTSFGTKFYNAELTIDTPLNNDSFKTMNGNHTGSASTVGIETGKFKGDARLPFNGSYAVSPDIGRYLKSCGYVEVDYKIAVGSNMAIGAVAIPVAANGDKVTIGQVITLLDTSNSNTENVTVITGSTGTSIKITATTKAYLSPSSNAWIGKGFVPLKTADSTTMTFGQYVEQTGGTAPVVVADYIF